MRQRPESCQFEIKQNENADKSLFLETRASLPAFQSGTLFLFGATFSLGHFNLHLFCLDDGQRQDVAQHVQRLNVARKLLLVHVNGRGGLGGQKFVGILSQRIQTALKSLEETNTSIVGNGRVRSEKKFFFKFFFFLKKKKSRAL